MKLEIRAIRMKTSQNPALPSGFGVVAAGDLAALVEVITPDFDLTNVGRLRRYQKAVNLCWCEGNQPILPARAGAVFDGPEEIGRILLENAADYKASLARIGNKLEMCVRFALQNKKEAEHAFVSGQNRGLDYMKWLSQRQAHEDTQLAAIDAVVKKLSSLAVDYQYYTPAPGSNFAEASFLLAQESLAAFRDVTGSCDIPAVVTGPFPPFDFV
ncbi:GvpL/GvpF family gas vesicle protein [Candidatus Chlorohelix sp.]|uniref:GvpL/GvpF family gas vesicle protein n=1 Tax=Candidatus Chlorohelix sp. TaxID=3139201 RepID=UPI00306666E9